MPMPDESAPYREACDRHESGLSQILDKLRSVGGGVMSAVLEKRHPGSLNTLPRPLEVPHGPPVSSLRAQSELKSQAFGWPERDFNKENCVIHEYQTEPWLSLKAGNAAVDFELDELGGGRISLGELLQTRPVVLTLGMYTCPAYQLSHAAESKLARTFCGDVHFVHVYSLEPHPKGDNSPDLGRPWELAYSKYEQAMTFGARREHSELISQNHKDGTRLLLDALSPGALVNPVWSTYGPAPRPGFLIRPDGIIDTSQLWFTAHHLEPAIRGLLKELS